MWPSKPEVLIYPTVWQISPQLRRQTWGFRQRPARRESSQLVTRSTRHSDFSVTS